MASSAGETLYSPSRARSPIYGEITTSSGEFTLGVPQLPAPVLHDTLNIEIQESLQLQKQEPPDPVRAHKQQDSHRPEQGASPEESESHHRI